MDKQFLYKVENGEIRGLSTAEVISLANRIKDDYPVTEIDQAYPFLVKAIEAKDKRVTDITLGYYKAQQLQKTNQAKNHHNEDDLNNYFKDMLEGGN